MTATAPPHPQITELGSSSRDGGKTRALPVRFIVSDASSYLYLDHHRPAQECVDRPFLQVTADRRLIPGQAQDVYSCSLFEALSDTQRRRCKDVDQWKYGPRTDSSSWQLKGGKRHSYLAKLSEPDTVERLTALWKQKDVRYVFGLRDTCNCYIDELWRKQQQKQQRISNQTEADTNMSAQTEEAFVVNINEAHCYVHCESSSPIANCSVPSSLRYLAQSSPSQYSCQDTFPDSLNNDLSVACAADVQGRNRLQRGLLYMSYLRWFYSTLSGSTDAAPDRAYEPVYAVVEDMQHDMPFFYKSEIMQDWAYQPFPLSDDNDDHDDADRSYHNLGTYPKGGGDGGDSSNNEPTPPVPVLAGRGAVGEQKNNEEIPSAHLGAPEPPSRELGGWTLVLVVSMTVAMVATATHQLLKRRYPEAGRYSLADERTRLISRAHTRFDHMESA